jgi:hypothetical protein
LKSRRVENDIPGRLVLVGGGVFRERHGWVNIVQTLCTQVWKLTNETCLIYSRNVGGVEKHNDGGYNSSTIYLIYCKNNCKCHNILPHRTEKLKIKLKTFFFSDILLLLLIVFVTLYIWSLE